MATRRAFKHGRILQEIMANKKPVKPSKNHVWGAQHKLGKRPNARYKCDKCNYITDDWYGWNSHNCGGKK